MTEVARPTQRSHSATGSREGARPPWQGALELAALGLAGVLLCELASRVCAALLQLGALWPLLAGLALGALGADFLSGVIHWLCDRFFSAHTPLIGPLLIAPFRAHHADPEAMLAHGRSELLGNSALPVIALLCAGRSLLPGPAQAGALALHCALLCFALAGLATNQFHCWAHAPRPPAAARCLQRWGVLISAERHARHHRGGFAQSYCITTGWLNPLLDRTGFFARLEAQIRRLQRWIR